MPINRKVLAVIPARWASTRFPGKPITEILGKPMVRWVLEQVQKASIVSKVVVATDDRRICDAVHKFGGEAVMTSPNHESGTDRVADVAKNTECDIVVNVQGDEPLIDPQDILTVLDTARKQKGTIINGMCPIEEEKDLGAMIDENKNLITI